MKFGKAAGLDGVPNDYIKYTSELRLPLDQGFLIKYLTSELYQWLEGVI